MKYDFADWRLAFEVELKMCSHDQFEGASSEVFKKSPALQMHASYADRDIKHIFLDFAGTFPLSLLYVSPILISFPRVGIPSRLLNLRRSRHQWRYPRLYSQASGHRSLSYQILLPRYQ